MIKGSCEKMSWQKICWKAGLTEDYRQQARELRHEVMEIDKNQAVILAMAFLFI